LKVAIITEGFSGTGYGHLTRCLSIYQAFEEKGIVPAFIANCDEHGKTFIPDVNVVQLNWLENEAKLMGLIESFDIALIDSYLAPIETYKKICKSVKEAVYIDDYIRLEYPPGTIVNGTIGAENLPYKKDNDHHYLLGIDYMPLRKEFWDVVVPQRNSNNIKNVLITFGAQDNENLTEIILDYFLTESPQFDYYIVSGDLDLSKKFNRENIYYHYALKAKEMLEVMLKCDLAVSAAGQTLYELARLGIPTIAIGVADNQKFNIEGWLKTGFIRKEIWWDDSDFLSAFNNEFENLLNNYTVKQIHKANGARKIVKKLLMQNDSIKFFLRRFGEKDIKNIYELSNDDEVRNVSINTNKIEWEEHVNWFNKILLDDRAYYLVAETNDEKLIGQIKFDIDGVIALISISIHKDYRGKGYATEILKLSCKDFFISFVNVDSIGAFILKDNIRSIRSFQNAGFEYDSYKLFNERIFNFYLLNRNQIK